MAANATRADPPHARDGRARRGRSRRRRMPVVVISLLIFVPHARRFSGGGDCRRKRPPSFHTFVSWGRAGLWHVLCVWVFGACYFGLAV